MGEVLALTWEVHRRTRSICREIGLQLHELGTDQTGLARYLKAGHQTLRLLWTKRPNVLLVQNPSIVLTCIAVLYKLVRPLSRIVVDAHNVAVEQLESNSIPLRLAARAVVRGADWTIVTNEALAERVRAFGGQPLVLVDPLPVAPSSAVISDGASLPAVVVIATYAADEPIEEVMAAAGKLVGDARFYFTGRHEAWLRRRNIVVPANVSFTGFLADADYWELLHKSRVILDLTTRDDCLVCGAYEAVAVGRPVVLSDSQVNRATFGDAAIYSGLQVQQIESAVRGAINVAADVIARADGTRKRLKDAWGKQSNALRRVLNESN